MPNGNDTGAQRPLPDNCNLMRAWNAHQATDDFANTVRWAQAIRVDWRPGCSITVEYPHQQGSHWSLFSAGYAAAQRDAAKLVRETTGDAALESLMETMHQDAAR